jgi:uncharacterized protein (DUF1330 family)
MPAYLVATTVITDAARFGEYQRAIAGLSASFGAEPVVGGPVSEMLEGEAPVGERVVVSRFPDTDSARAYIGSAQYQAARRLREGAAEVTIRLVVV